MKDCGTGRFGFHNRSDSGTGGENHRGFTLIEVLIALFILCVSLLGTAGLIAGIIKGNVHSRRVTAATTLAQEKMEEYRRRGYSGSPSVSATQTEDYREITGNLSFKRVTGIEVAHPGVNMKTVTVTVYWDSDEKSLVLKTIFAKETR